MTDMFSHKAALKALETYGANFALWPDQKLAQFVQHDTRFEAHVKRSIMLDEELSRNVTPAPSELLKSRVLKMAANSPQTPKTDSSPAIDNNSNATKATRNHAPVYFSQFAKLAALFLVCAILGGGLWSANNAAQTEQQYTATLDAETDAWRSTANDLDMADIFLWVETDEG